MEQLRWYFNHGKNYETFTVLYKKDDWMLVKSNDTKLYSFGLCNDFGTLFGFPVDQSCLSLEKLKEILGNFLRIDKEYIDTLGEIAKENIKRWEDMFLSVETE